MKPIDLTSTLVAGAIGSVLLLILSTTVENVLASPSATNIFSPTQSTRSFGMVLGFGFLVGAGTQIGVRLTGVS